MLTFLHILLAHSSQNYGLEHVYVAFKCITLLFFYYLLIDLSLIFSIKHDVCDLSCYTVSVNIHVLFGTACLGWLFTKGSNCAFNNEKLLKRAPLQVGRVAHKTRYFLRNHIFSVCCHNNCLLNGCGSIDRTLVLDILLLPL